MAEDTPDGFLARADGAARGSIERKLLVAAAFAAIALDDAVVVGGTAVELHTGSYRPTDIDLVGPRRAGSDPALRALGLRQEGRHWVASFHDGEALAVEVPDDRLGAFATGPNFVIDLEPGLIEVIGLDDLMMDRLLQATGGEPVTRDEAVRLAVAAYERVDWEGLAARAEESAVAGSRAEREVPRLLGEVRRAAVRLLRR